MSSPSSFRNVAAATKLVWSSGPRAFIGFALLDVVIGLIPPVTVYLGKRVVDVVARPAGTTVTDALPVLVAIAITLGASRAMHDLQASRTFLWARSVAVRAERRFLEFVAGLDVGHFDDAEWHDRMARARREVLSRPMNLTVSLIGLGGSFVTVVGMLGLLTSLHPALVLLAVAGAAPTLFLRRRMGRELYRATFERTTDLREAAYLGSLLTDAAPAKEVRAFGAAGHLLGRHRTITDRILAADRAVYRRRDRYSVLNGLCGGLALGVAYAFVIARGLRGEVTPGEVTLVTGAFVSVNAQLAMFLHGLAGLDEHARFLDDYFRFLDTQPLLPVRSDPVPIPQPLAAGIEFDDVWLSYPGAQEPALAGLTLRIEPGELIAFVGDNGAGKTTLVKALLRFYDAEHGAVRVGGVDVRDADPHELRSRIGVLFQDYARYEMTVRENVVFGRIDTGASDEELDDALRAARAEFLLKDGGLDRRVGRQFEGGNDLSGGEWQRLALARLIYRDADVWILDEPTSALDPEAEAGIFADLRENLRGRIGIVISHRFSTVRIADRIAVIADGRVSELGTHEELLARRGRYAELFELQAAGYR